jgi:hypothetical protein
MQFKEFLKDKISLFLIAWGVFTTLFYLVLLAIAPGEEWASSATYFPYDGSIVIATIVLLIVHRFYGMKSMEGKVWGIIMVGVFLWMVAELIWGVDVLLCEMGHTGMPAILLDNADYPFLAGYIFLVIGFIYKARHTELKPNMGYTFIINSLAGAFAIISIYLVTYPTMTSAYYSDSEIFYLNAYVAFDILLFAIALQIALYWGKAISKGWYLLSIALFSMMVADIGYAALDIRGIYFDGALIELAWVFAYLLIGLAANYQKKLHESFM